MKSKLILITLLALLAAGQNTVQAFEDTYSFNWTP